MAKKGRARRTQPYVPTVPKRTATKETKPYGRLDSSDIGEFGATKSGRLLQLIRRDMDLKGVLMRRRVRNEEVLSLAYQDGTMLGGGAEIENIRENSLNLPYRYVRWLESQATSKKLVVKVNRDAGPGQLPGGPGDEQTGEWRGIALQRVAYQAGYNRETAALLAEMAARGTSVMRIGYHEEAITLEEAQEVGKDAQSVVPEVLGEGDVEAKHGQAHAEISQGLATMAQAPMVQLTAGQEGVAAILERKASHDEAEYAEETQDIPKESTRLIRRRLWMRKRRVGEDVGWRPSVYDVEDSDIWWERHVWTVAEVKASDLFTDYFKREVKGYDARNTSGVARGGQTPSTNNMGADARAAQSEDILDDDERLVEWFEVWIRKPDMKSGGVRKIVSAECPDQFLETDDSNPHVYPEGHPLAGFNTIPGFFPFYDFTPIQSSLTVPERTCGIPPVAVGMPHFERLCELRRLTHESALRHSLRFYDVHPAHKDNKKLLDALKNGEDGHAEVMRPGQITPDGKVSPSIVPIQFLGNTLEVDRQIDHEESAWIKVMGMPPAVLNGVGQADTATQDQQGIAAGERESGAVVTYCERRMGDVFAGLQGLMRGCLDDEDFQYLLGEQGAAVMKAWQTGSIDDGDEITVTFGANAMAQEAVEKKQLMEGITLEKNEVDPVTGLGVYDTTPLFEELHRRLGVGAPQQNKTLLRALQQEVLVLRAQVQRLTGVEQGFGGQQGGKPGSSTQTSSNGSPSRSAGPNPTEGSAPTQGNLNAGALRGTVSPNAGQ